MQLIWDITSLFQLLPIKLDDKSSELSLSRLFFFTIYLQRFTTTSFVRKLIILIAMLYGSFFVRNNFQKLSLSEVKDVYTRDYSSSLSTWTQKHLEFWKQWTYITVPIYHITRMYHIPSGYYLTHIAVNIYYFF